MIFSTKPHPIKNSTDSELLFILVHFYFTLVLCVPGKLDLVEGFLSPSVPQILMERYIIKLPSDRKGVRITAAEFIHTLRESKEMAVDIDSLK